MREKHNKFLIGKLKHNLLNKMLENFVSSTHLKDSRVVVGSKIGEDAAVIDMGDNYLVAKTDPITFVTDEIGYYAVHVNVNDVVCTGATPKWFQSTILLPAGLTDGDLIEYIFKNIHDTCKSLGITVVGGHTEITAGIDRPILIGSLLGEVEKEKLVLSSGAHANDSIILTKGIFIEGTSIIAREKEEVLKQKGYDNDFIEKCKNYLYNPGISVYNEAIISNENFLLTSMHDLTEGGLFCGLAEIAIASDLGLLIKKELINILSEPRELSKVFKINPYSTISSGSLLISVNNRYTEDLINLLKKNGINSEVIGNFTSEKGKYLILDENHKKSQMSYSEIDEITKIV
ncbi:MAG: hydrogenase expression/formation protein [Candidatus Lokiarchaeota archaeon]|nr:hydrogenase expression/formation protein [Candidatus Lokiarchaeota archaeon]